MVQELQIGGTSWARLKYLKGHKVKHGTMAAASETIQTIARLTPLADVLAMVDLRVKPVTPRTLDVPAAAGRALASDAMAAARPTAALALLDGWALAADATLGAGG